MSAVFVAIQAYGQFEAGQNQRRLYNNQALQADYQAQLEHEAGQQQARVIRREGQRAVGAATAGYAASGVMVDSGSAVETQRDITHAAEHDAFQAILDADRRSRGQRLEAVNARESGNMASAAGLLNAATTLATGSYNGMKASGWRSRGPGFSGTQAPAPVVDLGQKG